MATRYNWIQKESGPPTDIIETAGRSITQFGKDEQFRLICLDNLDYCILSVNRLSGPQLYGFYSWNFRELPIPLIPVFISLRPPGLKEMKPAPTKRKSRSADDPAPRRSNKKKDEDE